MAGLKNLVKKKGYVQDVVCININTYDTQYSSVIQSAVHWTVTCL